MNGNNEKRTKEKVEKPNCNNENSKQGQNHNGIIDVIKWEIFFDIIIPICLRNKIPEEKRGNFFSKIKILVEKKWDGEISGLEELVKKETEIAVQDYKNGILNLGEITDEAIDEYLFEMSKIFAQYDATTALEFANFALKFGEEKGGAKLGAIGEQVMILSCLKDNHRRITLGHHAFYENETIKFLFGNKNVDKIREKLNEYRNEIIADLEAKIKSLDNEIEIAMQEIKRENERAEAKIVPVEKITWNSKKGKGLIYQLFEELIEKDFIKINKKGEIASMIEKHFQDENGAPIRARSLISMKSARAGNKPKRGNEEISSITNHIDKSPKNPL